MTEVRQRAEAAHAGELAAALRANTRAEVRFTPGDRAMYSYDASIYRQVPIGVVLPRDADDVEAALAVCRRFDVPVFGRGCGTGLAGQTVNAAVVFDLSKHMHEITDIDPQARRDGTRMHVGTTSDDELAAIIASGGRRGAIYDGPRQIRDTYADAIRAGLHLSEPSADRLTNVLAGVRHKTSELLGRRPEADCYCCAISASST